MTSEFAEEIHLKNREDIKTTPIKVTTSFSDVTNEEQFFFTETDNENVSKDHTFESIKQTQLAIEELVAK